MGVGEEGGAEGGAEGGGGEGGPEKESRGGKGEHTYLLLSRSDSTMVLQTGQEIAELDNSGFATQAPTVFAGNMGGGRYIVQVNWDWNLGCFLHVFIYIMYTCMCMYICIRVEC